jgi:hypothetical protein
MLEIAAIDMELWLLHVSTPAKYAHFDNTNVSQKLESNNEPFLADFKRGKPLKAKKATFSRTKSGFSEILLEFFD